VRREPPDSWPKRLADGEGEAADLLRKVDRQPRQAPSERAAWERTLRRLGRDSSHARLRVALAAGAGAGAVVGAVVLYAALARSTRGHADVMPTAAARVGSTTSAGAPAEVALAPRSPPTPVAAPAVPAATPDETPPPSDAPRIQLGRAAVGLPAGRAELLGEAAVTLSRGGRASAFATAAAATVDLDAGEVELAVDKRPLDASHVFEVTAGAYRFTVLGTRFRVVRANGDVTLSVTEGRVAVSRGAERLAVVTAGGF